MKHRFGIGLLALMLCGWVQHDSFGQVRTIHLDRMVIDIYPSVYTSQFVAAGNKGRNAETLRYVFSEIGTKQKTICIDEGKWEICTDLTIPTNITVKVKRGSYFYVCTNTTLCIDGELDAGAYRIFDGPGTVGCGNAAFIVGYDEWGTPEQVDGLGTGRARRGLVRDVWAIPTDSPYFFSTTTTNADGTKDVTLDLGGLDDLLKDGFVQDVFYGGETTNSIFEAVTTTNENGSKIVTLYTPDSWSSGFGGGGKFVLCGVLKSDVVISKGNTYSALVPMVGNVALSHGLDPAEYISDEGRLIVPENGVYFITGSSAFGDYKNPHWVPYVTLGNLRPVVNGSETGNWWLPNGNQLSPQTAADAQLFICVRRGTAEDESLPDILMIMGSGLDQDEDQGNWVASAILFLEKGQEIYFSANSEKGDSSSDIKARGIANAADYVPVNSTLYTWLSIAKIGGGSK